MVLTVNDIKQILPHRYPMLLVDRILEIEPMQMAVGLKNVTANEVFFNGHFPEDPIMPGVLIVEAMTQVAGIAVLYTEEHRGKVPVFAKISEAKFHKPVVPGDQLITTAHILRVVRNKMVFLKMEGRVDGVLVAEAEAVCALQPAK